MTLNNIIYFDNFCCRALCKHSHRSTEGFWGSCTGSELVKNNIALTILEKLFDNCVWINIHQMGGTNESEFIIEIRVKEGYGARWICQQINNKQNSGEFQELDIKFRGFVEPMMINGHEVGWKH